MILDNEVSNATFEMMKENKTYVHHLALRLFDRKFEYCVSMTCQLSSKSND